jgi:uncharacterized Zn finger protein (UPF0148 family)
LSNEISQKARVIQNGRQDAERLETRLVKLRQDWQMEFDSKFEFSCETVCPTCGQALPEDQLNQAREKAEQMFNARKAERIETINAGGKQLKANLDALLQDIATVERELDQAEKAKGVETDAIITLQAQIDEINASAGDVRDNPDYAKAIDDGLAIKDKISELSIQRQGVLQSIRSQIDVINQDIQVRERKLAQIDQAEHFKNRIAQLADEQKTLAAEYERLEGELYLTEQFVRAKVNLLESRINSKFKKARFKMFNQQVNGGIEECCDTLGDGVPYSGGLNNAARINIGLDIIETLSKHYEFTAPIFIDNAESVTELAQIDAQVIRLVVSQPDKTLRVEREQNNSLF